MSEQLTLVGEPVAPRRLTERQHQLLEVVRWFGEYGAALPTREARRFYVDPSGALRRLERLGLVRRAGRGRWRAT